MDLMNIIDGLISTGVKSVQLSLNDDNLNYDIKIVKKGSHKFMTSPNNVKEAPKKKETIEEEKEVVASPLKEEPENAVEVKEDARKEELTPEDNLSTDFINDNVISDTEHAYAKAVSMYDGSLEINAFKDEYTYSLNEFKAHYNWLTLREKILYVNKFYYYDKISLDEISETLNVSKHQTILKFIKTYEYRKLSTAIRIYYEKYGRVGNIYDLFGVKVSAPIFHCLCSLSIQNYKSIYKSIPNYNQPSEGDHLNNIDDYIDEIINDFKAGAKPADVAKKYDINYTKVWTIQEEMKRAKRLEILYEILSNGEVNITYDQIFNKYKNDERYKDDFRNLFLTYNDAINIYRANQFISQIGLSNLPTVAQRIAKTSAREAADYYGVDVNIMKLFDNKYTSKYTCQLINSTPLSKYIQTARLIGLIGRKKTN